MTTFLTFLLISSSLVFSASALAYVPPSSFIVKSVAAKHGGIKGLRVRSTVTVMEGEKPGAVKFKAVTHFNPQTQTIRAYALDEGGKRLFAIERKPENATAADAVLFWNDGRAVAAALKARGIPIRTEDELLKLPDEDARRAAEEVRLARWSATVTWIVGPGRDGEPGLWVEKDTFLPLRMTASPLPDERAIDYLFEGQRYYHEFPFPRVLIAVRKKEPLLRDEVIDVSLALDAAEFRGNLTPGFTAAGNAAPSDVRSLIQKYFEVVR